MVSPLSRAPSMRDIWMELMIIVLDRSASRRFNLRRIVLARGRGGLEGVR